MTVPRAALALGSLLGLLAPTLAHGATYYVGKTSCSATGAGTSASAPLCTFAQGVGKLKAGDTLIIQAGTYKERLLPKSSGTAAAPIIIQGEAGAIIDAQGMSINDGGTVDIDGQSYITVKGLTVRNNPYWGMQISNSHYITIEGNIVEKCEHGGIIVDHGSTFAVVTKNDVSGTDSCGQDCGIHEAIALSDAHNFKVYQNKVHDGVKEGIDCKDGSTAGEIYSNAVYSMGQVGIYLNHCRDTKIYANLVYNNGASGFQLATGDYAMGAKQTVNNKIYYNVVYNNAYSGVEFWLSGGGDLNNNDILNNVLYGNKHHGIDFKGDSAVANNRVRNNTIVKNGQQGVTGSAASANTITNNLFFQTGAAAGTSQVTSDPLFVNPTTGDFHIKTGSPAIDKGFDVGLLKVGAAPDIGAYELGAPDPGPGIGPGPTPTKDAGVTPGKDAGVVPKRDRGVVTNEAGVVVKNEAGMPIPLPEPDGGVGPGPDPNVNGKNGVLSGGCSVAESGAAYACGLLALILFGLAVLRRRRLPLRRKT